MVAVTQNILGTNSNGEAVIRYTLTHPQGMTVSLLNWGAIVTELRVADGQGNFRDVVLGLSNFRDYLENNPFYIGAAIGRTSGRIYPARIQIDGEDFSLTRNEADKHLHGGGQGLHNCLWRATVPDSSRPSILLETELSDGQEGYPGNIAVSFLCEWTVEGTLRMEYRATTDRPTLFNPTRHDYFNLGGHDSGHIGPHVVRLPQSRYLPVDEDFVESLPPRPVLGTLLDFRMPKPLGNPLQPMEPRLRGINYDFLNENIPTDEPVAEIYHPESRIRLRFFTNQKALQFYTGNFLDDSVPGKSGARYGRHAGFCLEAANCANAIHTPEWSGDCILRPGEASVHTNLYQFDTCDSLPS